MRILMDDKVCSFPAGSVGAAVDAAAEAAEQAGRCVVDVEVDGVLWGESELASEGRRAESAQEVRLVTAVPAELLRETFTHATTALLEAEQLLRAAARSLQADQPKEGMDSLMQALSVWMNIQRAVVDGLQFGRIDTTTLRTSEGTFNETTQDLNARLTALRDAMQAGDTVAVCDCLLYEFPTTTKRWAAMLAELARRCDAAARRVHA